MGTGRGSVSIACWPCRSPNGKGTNSICGLWPNNPASSAAANLPTRTIFALRSRAGSDKRSAMNSRSRSAPFTISRTTPPEMSDYGGKSTKSTRSQWPHACGAKANTCQHPTTNPSTRAALAESESRVSRPARGARLRTSPEIFAGLHERLDLAPPAKYLCGVPTLPRRAR